MVGVALVAAGCSGDDAGRGGRGGGDGAGNGSGSGGGTVIDVDPGEDGSSVVIENPKTCAEAEQARSYVGCEFWPTVTANPVFVEFDFAVVVANGQEEVADVTIAGPSGFQHAEVVPPGELRTILLPWVADLKGPEFSVPNTNGGRLTTSLAQKKGAYQLTASVPITAWQFNPLQYRKAKGTGEGQCGARISAALGAAGTECRAASNDASLLLPTAAMTGNYRVAAYSNSRGDDNWGSVPSAVAITATKDGTTVTVELSPFCAAEYLGEGDGCLVAGPGIQARNRGEVFTLEMNAGDVVQLLAEYGPWPQVPNADLSGTVINATAPVQVISLNAIAMVPTEVGNADHIEETVLPAEVIGKKYIVAPPTAYGGTPVGHIVRIYGNVDGTKLTYAGTKPPGAPDTIDAGQVVQLPPPPASHQCPSMDSTCYLTEAFVVEADQPFMVASFLLGGDLQVPNYADQYAAPGDPSFSMLVTPEQFRKDYTFLAPADFMENYADILVPEGAQVELDGAALAGAREPIADSGWSIVRAPLSGSAGGIHHLSTTDDRGVGLQVLGFGSATSYYYPGGLNLKLISEPPVIVVR